MSDKIKPSEVSDVLLQQLQEVNSGTQFDEVGTVLTVATVWRVSTDCATLRPASCLSLRMARWPS